MEEKDEGIHPVEDWSSVSLWLQIDHCDIPLNLSVFPAVSNGFICHCIPGILSHLDCLEKVDLEYIILSSFIQINCAGAELSPIMCLKASNDSSIKWLNIGCEVGLEKFDSDIGRSIRD